jgi:CheY-like chemotaxis protein
MTAIGTPIHVLVVDDDRDLRETLVEILEERGYQVSQAGDGAQALHVLEAGATKPSLILLDLTMPGMDGSAFRTEQLKDPALAAIPILVFTADGHAREKAEGMGAQGLVRKPLELKTLLAAIDRLLGQD